jgi:hypothetical protein
MKRVFFSLIVLGFCSSLGAQPPRAEHAVESNNPQLTLDGTYRLRIPFVDSDAVPGLYQDVEIEYAPQTRTWRMVSYNTGVLLPPQNIEKVEAIVTQQRPFQAFLRVTGYYSHGCGFPPRVSQRRSGDMFEVSVFSNEIRSYPPAPPMACPAVIVPFVKTIPLDVYGLRSAPFRYRVNGSFELQGGFVLLADNTFFSQDSSGGTPVNERGNTENRSYVAIQPPNAGEQGSKIYEFNFFNNPTLYNPGGHYVLALPFVDAEIPGMYQGARIEYMTATGTWRLERQPKGLPIALNDIARVDVSVTSDLPVQAFVKIEGTFRNSCHEVSTVTLRRTGDTFNVYVFYRVGTINCTATQTPFSKSVSLPLYGLPAGRYTYTVNGEFPGVVVLDRNNVYE